MPPEHIGRYELVGRAGSGGFATVYEALDPRLDTRVAIKVLADNWSGDPEIRRRFRQEAVLLRRMQTEHGVPGLIEIFDIDETAGGQPFFVMGWAGGGTLASRAADHVWPPATVRPIVVALTQTLGHLHAQGVVHRDVKPSNLLIRSDRAAAPGSPANGLVAADERIVLADFGLAKDLAVDSSALSFVAGTERYMAPEQLAFGAVDHRVDVYASTVMIADLLSGRGRHQLTPELQAVIDRGTATSPDARFASMADWQDALLTAFDSQDRLHLAAGQPAERPSTTRRPSRVVALMLALATAAAAVAGYLAFRSSGPDITGPATIVSGTTATYLVVDAQGPVEWVDPTGTTSSGPSLAVTARLPGELTISATTDGETTTQRITVEASAAGPRIIGPTTLAAGESATFRADIPDGHRFFWLHPTQGQLTELEVTVTGTQAPTTLGLVSVDASGVQRGDQIQIAPE